MKLMSIMSTNIQIITAPDLSLNNKVMNFKQVLPKNIYSGATLLISEYSAHDSLQIVLDFFWDLLKQKLPNYDIWLLVGNSIGQPNTRITRYYGLWGSLKARGINIPDKNSLLEATQEIGEKLKFFGAKRLSRADIDFAIKVILEERCTYLIALPSSEVPDGLISAGWQGDIDQDIELISEVRRLNGAIIKAVGEFDDIQRGLLYIGDPAIVATVLD